MECIEDSDSSSLQGAKAMPELNKYAGEWPLVGAIQSKLKYTSSRAREASKKGVSKKILEAAKEAEVPVLAKRPPVSRGRSRVVRLPLIPICIHLLILLPFRDLQLPEVPNKRRNVQCVPRVL